MKFHLEKDLYFPILLFAVLVIFHPFFENLLSETLVKYFLSFCKSTYLTDIILVVLVVFFFYKLYSSRKKSRLQISYLLWLIFIDAIYLYYRISNNIWTFTPFKIMPAFKYADILIVIGIVYLVIHLFKFKVQNPNSNSVDIFFDDEPLGKDKPDQFGYEKYANEVAKRIENTKFNKAFAIGINGQWGIGKTSFIDLIKRNLKKDDKVVIDFNPWNSSSPDLIIQDFFNTLQEEIRPIHHSLANQIISYSEKLSSIGSNAASQFINLANLTLKESTVSTNDLYTQINKQLKILNLKIVIFIDDVDRLNKTELLSVIRLIRNTADFYNTYFVVAYDRNYVLRAIKKHNSFNHQQFLEKIFQLEINLPYFNKKILREKLAEKLMLIIPSEYHKEIKESISDNKMLQSNPLDEWLTSMRDVTRLANSIALNYSQLQGEVIFDEFRNLEILRTNHPSVYELIYRHADLFIEIEQDSYQKYTYHFKKTSNGHELELTNYLIDNYENLSILKEDVSKIVNLLSTVFNGANNYYSERRDHLSVAYPSNFKKYFAYSLLEGNLSELEFTIYRKKNIEEFKTKISSWIEQGLQYELVRRFEEIDSFDDKQDFENIILAIFYIGNHDPAPGTEKFWHILGFNSENLKNKVYDYYERLSNTIYEEYGGKDTLRNFLLKVFHQAKSPYEFECKLIEDWLKYPSEEFLLKKEELIQININYLKNYCQTTDKLDNNLWGIFQSCKIEKKLVDEGKEIFIKFISDKDLDGFLHDTIYRERWEGQSFELSKMIPTIFDSWQDFEVFLENQSTKKWKHLKEFKEFYKKYVDAGYNPVPFDFKVIPVKQRNE